MKPLSRLFAIAALTIALVFVAHIQVFADTYYTATFTGGVQWPTGGGSFDGITWDPAGVSGNFVYDGTLIPGPGTGWVNVFFDNTSAGGFPDVGSIPAGTLFTIHLGATPLTFTFADANLEPYNTTMATSMASFLSQTSNMAVLRTVLTTKVGHGASIFL